MSSQTFQVITIELSEDQTDLISGLLHNEGSLGVEEIKHGSKIRIKSYHEESLQASELMELIHSYCPDCLLVDAVKISLSQVPFQPASFEPLELTKNFWIIPPADMPTESNVTEGQTLIIRPGAAFGTGRHESTQLASEALLHFLKEVGTPHFKNHLIDIGTGSGVLSIFAKILGAQSVVAVEIDEEARLNAAENFELNKTSVELFGNLNKVDGQFDVIVANILAPTLIYLKTRMKHLLSPDGILIMSGVVQNEEEQILKNFSEFTLVKKWQKNEWVCFAYKLAK